MFLVNLADTVALLRKRILRGEFVITNKEADNVGRDLVLSGNCCGHSASPTPTVPGPDVSDHDPTIHRRETKILKTSTFLRKS